jgi:hypothetical protein
MGAASSHDDRGTELGRYKSRSRIVEESPFFCLLSLIFYHYPTWQQTTVFTIFCFAIYFLFSSIISSTAIITITTTTMPQLAGKEVGPIGYGLMGMSSHLPRCFI